MGEIAPAEWSGSEEKPQEGGNGWGCCNRCWDWRCKHSPCCHKKKESESSPSEPAPAPAPAPAAPTDDPQEGGNGWPWGCCHRCWSPICKHSPCCHKKQESDSSPSVSDLVKAGLEQLKAEHPEVQRQHKESTGYYRRSRALKGQKTSKGEIFTL